MAENLINDNDPLGLSKIKISKPTPTSVNDNDPLGLSQIKVTPKVQPAVDNTDPLNSLPANNYSISKPVLNPVQPKGTVKPTTTHSIQEPYDPLNNMPKTNVNDISNLSMMPDDKATQDLFNEERKTPAM